MADPHVMVGKAGINLFVILFVGKQDDSLNFLW